MVFVFSCDLLVGPEGEKGAPGNANIDIRIFECNRDSVNISGYYGNLIFDIPEITQSIYDSGAVCAYFEEDGQWITLPNTFLITPNSIGEYVEINYAYNILVFSLYFQTTWLELKRSMIPEGRIKVVIIHPEEHY